MRKFNVSIPVPSMEDLKGATKRTSDRTKTGTRNLRHKLAEAIEVNEIRTEDKPLFTEADPELEALLDEQDARRQAVRQLTENHAEDLREVLEKMGVNPSLLGQGDPNARIVDVS